MKYDILYRVDSINKFSFPKKYTHTVNFEMQLI